MARTDAGAALTVQHRRRQLALRALTVRELQRVWPAWSVEDSGSFDSFAAAATTLTVAQHRQSARLAGDYYTAFRTAEGVDGRAALRLADDLERGRVAVSLRATGLTGTVRALRAGQTMEQARQSGFVALAGSVSRHVLNGGRDTVLGSVRADRQATGWQRVTSGRPCAFCAMIAGRGGVFRSDTANFQAHDHCACTAEPVYPGSAAIERNEEFARQWDESQAAAREAGEMARGTSNDPLNAFRRAFEGG